jgi:O-antigen/teichoic acid export membrane protein
MIQSLRRRFASSRLARQSLWMLVGQGGRAVLQAVYFIILARSLGVSEYGAFVGVVSLVAIVTPFASFGFGLLLIQKVSQRDGDFADHWGQSLTITTVIGLVMIAVISLAARRLLPPQIPLGLVLAVAVSDLLFSQLCSLSAQAFQAAQRMERTAQITIMMSLLRVTAAIAQAALFPSPKASDWAGFYVGITALGAVICLTMVTRELGRPRFGSGFRRSDFHGGFFYSISLASRSIYNDIDKAMLARLSTLSATGVYAAGYRLIDVAHLPVQSMLGAAFGRFFEHGLEGSASTFRFAVRLLKVALGYAVVAAAVIAVGGPIWKWVLGKSYTELPEVVMILALILPLRAIHSIAADALTGAGRQRLRSLIQVGVAIFNIALNFWVIPQYSWRGAAWSSVVCDGLLAVGLWSAAWALSTRPPAKASV